MIPAEFAKGLDDLMDQRVYRNLQLLLIKDSLPGSQSRSVPTQNDSGPQHEDRGRNSG